MEIPPIQLRRSPRVTLSILLFGLLAAAVGLFFGQMIVIFLGVLPILLAGLMMLNPMVVLADDHVELKNLFGLTRASYDHDGLHLVQVLADDMIYIQKGDMRAPLRRIVRARLHAADWDVMLQRLEAVRQMRKQQGNSKSMR
jgi:hypothetical protein